MVSTEDSLDIGSLPPMIFNHALAGTMSSQTTKLSGNINKHKVYVLIDSCSTQNFLSASLSAKPKLPISTKN